MPNKYNKYYLRLNEAAGADTSIPRLISIKLGECSPQEGKFAFHDSPAGTYA
jgi:hypothetical protein